MMAPLTFERFNDSKTLASQRCSPLNAPTHRVPVSSSSPPDSAPRVASRFPRLASPMADQHAHLSRCRTARLLCS
jgi:hypothetical protein